MTASAINEIENQFAQLSPEIQLSLLERLDRRMRQNFDCELGKWEAELTAMAADAQIQDEIGRIDLEFRAAEADGLGKILMAVRRGEIYLVNLDPVQGREQAGYRPVLVLSSDSINRLPLVVSVVIGTKGENVARDYAANVRVPPAESGFPMETVFLCFQLRSLDPGRLAGPPAGKISGVTLAKIETAVRHCLGL